jgi:hypothetical protein
MRKVAHVIDGRYGDPKACLTTVVQYWKNLTVGWRRAGRQKIKDEDVLSTSNVSGCSFPSTSTRNTTILQFIKGPMQNEMSLARQKRTMTLRYRDICLHKQPTLLRSICI